MNTQRIHPNTKDVQFCPRCGSPNLYKDYDGLCCIQCGCIMYLMNDGEYVLPIQIQWRNACHMGLPYVKKGVI